MDTSVADPSTRLTDPSLTAVLAGGELDQSIGALAAARASLLEYNTVNPGMLTETLERLAQLSQLAIQARLAAATSKPLSSPNRWIPRTPSVTKCCPSIASPS